MHKNQLPTLSNVFFLLPAYYALHTHVYWYAILVLSACIVSTAHHIVGKKKLLPLDKFFAFTLVLVNFYLLFAGGLLPLHTAIFALLTATIATTLFVLQRRNYWLMHSLYHFLSAIVCLLCLYVYLY